MGCVGHRHGPHIFCLLAMKYFSICLFLLLLQASSLFAQNRHDNNWVFGRLGNGIFLNFDNDSLHVGYVPEADMRTGTAHISMSDAEGNLLFYSNNCSISDAQHQIMENGEGLNPGVIQTYWCSVNPYANPYNQSIISLPYPGQEGKYMIFHVDSEIFNFGGPGGAYVTPKHVLLTIVDMNKNNGLGEVVDKNVQILQDTLAGTKLIAVKHANGRDWWLLTPEYRSNCYYKILVSKGGISISDKQCIGYVWNKYDEAGGSLFTSSGDKFIRSNDMNGLNIFDFDRCTGDLSNPIHISLAPDTNALTGLSISKSGRFVYFNTLKKIYQFDLQAQDIAASKVLVATYDGFKSAGNSTDFYYSKLAPDGKIYFCTFGPTYYLHTINQPDSVGLACQVLQHNVILPITHYATMPNSPNYQLGALPGPCDTISVSTNDLKDVKNPIEIFPNPTSGDIQIRNESGVELRQIQVFNLTGKLIFSLQCNSPNVSIIKSNHHLEKGFYLIKISDKYGHPQMGKIIIE